MGGADADKKKEKKRELKKRRDVWREKRGLRNPRGRLYRRRTESVGKNCRGL